MSDPALKVHGLEKAYPGFSLGPLDLELASGTVAGLIGPNGSGKSTTLGCIAGTVVPGAGDVAVFGRAACAASPGWRRLIGIVGEDDGFFQRWTGAENLRFLSRFHSAWSWPRVRGLATRLELPLDKRVRDLSRGNRTKLRIVAALGHLPGLLLLDEPTSGLDPVVRSELLDVFWEFMEDGDKAILYSTHVLSDISRLADDLIFLRDGRLLLRTSKEELVESWRRITFRMDSCPAGIAGAVDHRSVRREHQVVSSDREATLAHLGELGAEGIEQSRMTVEEIAVEVLKGERHVDLGA